MPLLVRTDRNDALGWRISPGPVHLVDLIGLPGAARQLNDALQDQHPCFIAQLTGSLGGVDDSMAALLPRQLIGAGPDLPIAIEGSLLLERTGQRWLRQRAGPTRRV